MVKLVFTSSSIKLVSRGRQAGNNKGVLLVVTEAVTMPRLPSFTAMLLPLSTRLLITVGVSSRHVAPALRTEGTV